MPFRPITQPSTATGFKPIQGYAAGNKITALPQTSGLPSFLNPAGVKPTAEDTARWKAEAPSGLETFGRGVGEFAAGVVSEAPKIAGDVASFAGEIASAPGMPPNPIQWANEAAKAYSKTAQQQEGLQQTGQIPQVQGQNLMDLTSQAGNTVGDFLKGQFSQTGLNMQSGPATAGGIAAQIGASVYGGSQGANLGKGLIQGSGKLASLGRAAATSALSTLGSTVPLTGKTPTPQQFAEGAALDAVTGVAGKVLKKTAGGLYKIGIKPEAKNIRQLDKRVQEALDLNLTGTNKQISEKATNVIKTSGKQLSSLLKKQKTVVPIEDLLTGLEEKITKATKEGQTEKAAELVRLSNSYKAGHTPVVPLTDVLDSKRYAAQVVLPTLKKGTDVSTASQAGKLFYETIQKNADKLLNKVSPRVKTLNNKMSAAYSVIEPAFQQYKKGFKFDATNLKAAIPASTIIPTTLGGNINRVANLLPSVASAVKGQRTKTLK